MKYDFPCRDLESRSFYNLDTLWRSSALSLPQNKEEAMAQSPAAGLQKNRLMEAAKGPASSNTAKKRSTFTQRGDRSQCRGLVPKAI